MKKPFLFLIPMLLLLFPERGGANAPLDFMCVASVTVDNNVSCFGGTDGSATATGADGVAPYTYAWADGQNTATAVGLSAGTYTVTITDSDACTATAEATITEPTNLLVTISASSFETTCYNPTVSIDAFAEGGTSPYTYQWSDGSTGQVAVVTVGGIYTVTITDSNGCTLEEVVTIGDNQTPPNILLVPSDSVFYCGDSSIILDAGGTSNGKDSLYYEWNTGWVTSELTITEPGTYTVTVTNAYNGCPAEASITIDGEPGTAQPFITGNVYCDGEPGTTLDAGDGYATYLWSSGETTQTIFATEGVYTVTVSDGGTCTGEASTTVMQMGPLSPTIDGDTLLCGGSGVIGVSGNFLYVTYVWSDGSTTADISISAPGTYTVTVTDVVYGCTATAETTIQVSPLSAGFSTNEWGDLAVEFTADENNAQYTYAWDFGDGGTATGATTTHQYADYGTYQVCLSVTDGTGETCSSCESFTFNNPDVCLDWTQIDFANAPCTNVYEPVCGCDGVEYTNSCIALWCFGVTQWTAGPCTPEPTCPVTAEFFYYGEQTPDGTAYDLFFFGFGENVENYTWDFGNGILFYEQIQEVTIPNYDSLTSFTVCLTTANSSDTCTATVCETIVLDDTPNGTIGGEVVEGSGLWGGNEVERIMNAEGDPIAGATVELLDPLGTVIQSTVTAADGSYLFENLILGDYFVKVNIPGISHVPYLVTIDPVVQGFDNIDFGVNADWVSGMDGVAFLEGFGLSPNPTSGAVALSMTLPERADIQLSVVNMLGKTIRSETLTLPAGRQIKEVSLDGLPAGVYIVHLQSGGEGISRKVVKR